MHMSWPCSPCKDRPCAPAHTFWSWGPCRKNPRAPQLPRYVLQGLHVQGWAPAMAQAHLTLGSLCTEGHTCPQEQWPHLTVARWTFDWSSEKAFPDVRDRMSCHWGGASMPLGSRQTDVLPTGAHFSASAHVVLCGFTIQTPNHEQMLAGELGDGRAPLVDRGRSAGLSRVGPLATGSGNLPHERPEPCGWLPVGLLRGNPFPLQNCT